MVLWLNWVFGWESWRFFGDLQLESKIWARGVLWTSRCAVFGHGDVDFDFIHVHFITSVAWQCAAVTLAVASPRGDFSEVRLQEVVEHVQEAREIAEVRRVLPVAPKIEDFVRNRPARVAVVAER